MATAATVKLTPSTHPVYPPIQSHRDKDSNTTASTLLQTNHDKFHMFFNPSGFHNHIAHHLLTIYALGATPEQIQHAFNLNRDIQRPQFPCDESNVMAMSDPSQFQSFLGDEKYFHDWEAFFRREMDATPAGWQGVLQQHLFSRTPNAEALMVRMYAGFLHPLIHLGFGIEFAQPAIIVEALAQAAVHDGWIGPFLLDAEQHAESSSTSNPTQAPASIPSLLHAIHANKTLAESPHWCDGNKIRDGILVRAPQEMLSIASQYHIPPPPTTSPSDLEKYTAEMTNACTYFTACSQFRHKKPKFDFYYMHCMNSSIFFSAFLQQDDTWFPLETKIRFLEWKVRLDLVMYASRKAPRLHLDRVSSAYISPHVQTRQGKEEEEDDEEDDGSDKDGEWQRLFQRASRYEDDGHTSKLVRAVGNAERICRPFENWESELHSTAGNEKRFVIRGKMWRDIGYMVMDSVSDLQQDEPRWVRNCGFEQAWEKVPDLQALKERDI